MSSFFSSIEYHHILISYVSLISFEILITKVLKLNKNITRIVLVNIWQLFGIILPVFWLLNKKYGEYWLVDVVIALVFAISFGIVKPTILDKKK